MEFSPNGLISKNIDLIFSEEELFYSSYNFIILDNKKTLNGMYKSILEYSQIYFMFNASKIFEEKLYMVVYYFIKIKLYLLINVNLITKATLNTIYDNELILLIILYII